MADINNIATLGVTIDGTQAVRSAKEIGVAIDQMGAKADVSGNAFLNLSARAQDFARAGASAQQVQRMTGVTMQGATAAVKQYAGSVAQAEIDVGGLKIAQEQLALAGVKVGATSAASAGFLDQLSGSTHAGSLGMSYLRREMLSVAATMTNTNPILARMGFTLAALGGSGKLAITGIVGLAAAGLALKAGMAIYEKINAVAIANSKAFTEWQKSAEGVAAQADADQRSMAALAGSTAAATIVIHGQTVELEKLRKGFADIDAQLRSGVSGWTRLKDMIGGMASGLPGLNTNAIPLTFLRAMEDELAKGRLTVAQYRAGLQDLGRSFPNLSKNIQQAELLASDLEALRKRQDELTAANEHANAVSVEQAASLSDEASFARRRIGAAQSGGTGAVQRLDDEHAALKRAAEDWAEYIKSSEGAAFAGMTFAEALAAKNAMAMREHDLALQTIKDNERTKQTLEGQAQAAKDAAQNTKDLADQMAKLAEAYDKEQAAETKAKQQNVTDLWAQMAAIIKAHEADVAKTAKKAADEVKRAAEEAKKAADEAARAAQREQERRDRYNRRAAANGASDIGTQLLNQWLPSMTNPNTAGGRIGGAVEAGASEAAAGLAAGGPLGAVIGGIHGFVSSMFSSGAKAKAAAREFKVASSSFQASLAGFVAAGQSIMSPGGFNAQLLAIKAQAASLQQNADQIYGHHKDDAANSAAVAAINAAEAVRIQQLQQEAELLRKTTDESLQARKLAAEGQSQAAAALNLQIQQQNEYLKAVEAGWTATQLATLKQVQAMEAVRAAANGLSSSFLNLNDGFRVASDWFHAQLPQGGGSGPSILPKMPGGGGTGTVTVNVQLDGKTIATSTLKQFKSKASAQYGDTTKWSQIS